MALEVRIGLDGTMDDEELDEALQLLLEDLADQTGGDVRPVAEAGPLDGRKGADVAKFGELVVTLGNVPEALAKLVAAVRHWLGHNRDGYSVRIVLGGDELVVDRVDGQTQQRLIEAFLAAHPVMPQQAEAASLEVEHG